MIHQDFCNLPPKMYLMNVLDKTSQIYVYLWERKNALNRICMSWDDVRLQYNKNTFKTALRKLLYVGLLNYEDSPDHVEVELVGWEEGEE